MSSFSVQIWCRRLLSVCSGEVQCWNAVFKVQCRSEVFEFSVRVSVNVQGWSKVLVCCVRVRCWCTCTVLECSVGKRCCCAVLN